ncbi:DUF397 domain-containing protein [Streptomyces sp. NPDC097640]|uniref:DUF397 domain-containing protein n=1 Tax=Streptomyces sp. NPDC097640 TaxID=3157229 RepID=UPI0033265810
MSTTPDLTTTVWRKSSYSNADQGTCVEVADGHPGIVPIRDSKQPHGPVLIFPAPAWSAFVAELKGAGIAMR